MTLPTAVGQVAAQDFLQRRQQDAENSTRPAFSNFSYTSTGVGTILVPKPMIFDCYYIEEPGLSTGTALASRLDIDKYKPPVVTQGVRSWIVVTQDQLFSKPATSISQLIAEGVQPPAVAPDDLMGPTGDTDFSASIGSDGRTVYYYVGAYVYVTVDLESIGGAPRGQFQIHHHFVFTGTAMKAIDPRAIQAPLSVDRAITPKIPPALRGN